MSESQVEFEMDERMLGNIRKAFAAKASVEIGLMNLSGDDGAKAMTHEYGNDIEVTPAMSGYFKQHFGFRLKKEGVVIPQRSFLRKTVANKAEEFIAWLGSASDIILDEMIEGNWQRQLETMGRIWTGYVKECFDTRGFGQWAPLSPVTIADKGHDAPLIRTGRMRDSIQAKVAMK